MPLRLAQQGSSVVKFVAVDRLALDFHPTSKRTSWRLQHLLQPFESELLQETQGLDCLLVT